jgi:hypothetical protein
VLDAANKAIEGIELSTDKEFAKEFFIKGYNSAPQVDGEPVAWNYVQLKDKDLLFNYFTEEPPKSNPILAKNSYEIIPLFTYQPDAAAKITQLEAEVKHWKSNHAHEVERARLIKSREDLSLERLSAYDRCALDKLEQLESDRAELVDVLSTLVSIVGLTAFKYEAQRKVLQDAVDMAANVLTKMKGKP